MSTPMYDVPEHMLIPVNADGEGPVSEADAVSRQCWCSAGPDCQVVVRRGASLHEDLVESADWLEEFAVSHCCAGPIKRQGMLDVVERLREAARVLDSVSGGD